MKNQSGSGEFNHITFSRLIRYIFLAFCVVLIGVVINACASTSAEGNETDENAFIVVDADSSEDTDSLPLIGTELSEIDADVTEADADVTDTDIRSSEAEYESDQVEADENAEQEFSPEGTNTTDNSVSEPVSDEETEPETSESQTDVQAYTYTNECKTMYTTTALNIRTDPSVDFERIGTYASGAEVAVTGVCNETGWSRVDYDGSVGYCCSDYLTDTKPIEAKPTESQTTTTNETNTNTNTDTTTDTTNTAADTNISAEIYTSGGFPFWNYSLHSGAYIGRMCIPSVGVNVGLYNTNAQSAIDAWDSAAIAYHWEKGHDTLEYSTILCADHNYQGFIAIANCTIGCVMYIDGVDGNTYKYVCDRIDYNGYNTGYGLNDCNGNSVNYTGGIWCYTCHTDSLSSIYMVHFVAV